MVVFRLPLFSTRLATWNNMPSDCFSLHVSGTVTAGWPEQHPRLVSLVSVAGGELGDKCQGSG